MMPLVEEKEVTLSMVCLDLKACIQGRQKTLLGSVEELSAIDAGDNGS